MPLAEISSLYLLSNIQVIKSTKLSHSIWGSKIICSMVHMKGESGGGMGEELFYG